MSIEQLAETLNRHRSHPFATDEEMALWWDAMTRGDGRDKAGNRYTNDSLHRVAYLMVRELRRRNDDLTRQLDDARTKAIDAGIFTSTDGDQSRYTHALNTDTCEGCGRDLWNGLCHKCETEVSAPGTTSYTPPKTHVDDVKDALAALHARSGRRFA